MKKFERGHVKIDKEKRRLFFRDAVANGATEEQAQALWKQEFLEAELYVNDVYQVQLKRFPPSKEWPAYVWLSIKRLDKQPIHDWRDLQEIKNELIGPENEGVELYPAESRCVDTANQYHMFVLSEAGIKFPFGFAQRAVSDSISMAGSVQRPFGNKSI